MQKKLLCPVLLMCIVTFQECTLHDKRDYFTGSIEYEYSYESSTLNRDSLLKEKPYKSIFRYDAENYQSKFIGNDSFTYSYSGKLNKCLSVKNSERNYECEDYGVSTDSIFAWKIYDTDEKVAGYSCRIIEFQTRIFWNRYYVSRDLKIPPDTYKNHIAYNWSFYGDKADGGLILKLEHRFKKYTMKGIVRAVTPGDKSFSAFQLPEALFLKICR